MNKMLPRINKGILAIVVAIVALQTTATAQDAEAPARSLEGVWMVTITPRNCATNDVFPALAFESIFTFHRDGTLLSSLRNRSLTLDRTADHGLWRRDLGWNHYSIKYVHLRRNAATGEFAGKQESRGAAVLSASGDEFTLDGSTTVFNVAGQPVTTGCATAVGIRFEFDQ